MVQKVTLGQHDQFQDSQKKLRRTKSASRSEPSMTAYYLKQVCRVHSYAFRPLHPCLYLAFSFRHETAHECLLSKLFQDLHRDTLNLASLDPDRFALWIIYIDSFDMPDMCGRTHADECALVHFREN